MGLKHIFAALLLGFSTAWTSLTAATEDKPRLILRVDDIGMSHATNQGLADLAALNIPFAASVMFTTPWYQEGVAILKANPHISVGVHLTLNAEWRHYRWGPIAGRNEVPSLINDTGYFYPSTALFLEQEISLDEVRIELEAQIQRALATGLNIAYVDYHMRTALATPEMLEVVTGLARKYELRMSMRMGEAVTTMFDVPVEDKKSTFLHHLSNSLDKDKINVLVIHAARNQPEMQALIDLNNASMNTAKMEPLVAQHRGSELDMLLSPEFMEFTEGNRVEVINYHMIDNPFSKH